MGIRLLFLLLALAAIWLILRHYWRTSRLASDQKSQAKIKADNMVSCEYCGLHVPEKEALKVNDRWYCCQQHADAAKDD